MENDLDIRLKADRIFVKHLCEVTGKSASSLATGAGVAATTLNRYVSRKAKPSSTLKDSTIAKIAKRWSLDYLELAAYRKDIEEALRDGRPVPAFDSKRASGLKEHLFHHSFEGPTRDPLMDRIMGATYNVWFNGDYREAVAFERLPDLVRLLYGRSRAEPRTPSVAEIKKRAADMLAGAAMAAGKKK